MTNEDFLDFIAFVLTDGSPEAVAALNRAIDRIRGFDREDSSSFVHPKPTSESGYAVYREFPS
ncbi:hypothetical protein [Methylorubrum thiocyanatum]|uniref:hypothetical protein n=1 Tax=Methylorubrum thiocyanatum TaxID=47958 RepID=UPI0015F86525|nr:hypothetical protein [Methylorubrum thiocyanatum]